MAFVNFVFIFALTFSSQLWANFSCHSIESNTYLYYTPFSGDKEMELVEFEFQSFSFLPSMLSCASFYDQLNNSFSVTQKLSDKNFIPLLTFTENKAARVGGELREYMYKLCAKSLGCKLRFPFSLISSYDNTNHEKRFKKSNPACLTKKNVERVPSSVAYFESLFTPLEFFDISEKRITDDFLKTLDSQNWKRVYVSSMTMSKGFISKIIEKAPKLSTEIHIFFSLTLQSLLQEFPYYLYELPKNIFIHPIFLAPDAVSSYHIKGALFVGEKPIFYFFTGNFRNYDEQKFSDFAMKAMVKNISLVENYFNQIINQNCDSQIFLDCTLKTRFERSSSTRDLIESLVAKSCKKQRSPLSDVTISLSARNTDIMQMIHERLKNAKKSIFIQTNQFNDLELLNILENKKKSNLDIKLLIGASKNTKSFTNSFIQQNVSSTEFHSKYIIIDQSEIIWTTGNFTKTAYLNPWESTFILKDSSSFKFFSEHFYKSWSESKVKIKKAP